MPRAHRYYMPGYIWHLTHRCHRKQFLLRYKRDRLAWVHWSESVAVGSRAFAQQVIGELGVRARDRRAENHAGLYVIREAAASYGPGIQP